MMSLSKLLTFGFAGSVCALALAVVSEPSAAQSRFNGQNDVPGAVIVDPDKQKINPDTIPEFPSTGDTSIRPRFYMSPGSRCTELEDPLPGGCEANNVQRDSRLLAPVEGRILPFPLALTPLPPVALAPLPKVNLAHLPPFVAHPVLPPVLALPLIVRPVTSLPAVHIVYPAMPTPARGLANIAPPEGAPMDAGRYHKLVRLHDLGFAAGRDAPSRVPGLDAALDALAHIDARISVETLQAAVPGLAFLKSEDKTFSTVASVPSANSQVRLYSDAVTQYGIAHPLHAPPVVNVRPELSARYADPVYRVVHQAHRSFSMGSFTNPGRSYPLRAGQRAAVNPNVASDTVVKSLARNSTIHVGSPPYSHGVTVPHPTSFVIH